MLRRIFAGAAIAAFAWREVVALPEVSSDSGGNSTKTTHIVNVGKGEHKFSPEIVIANVGDKISFQFYPLNHSVVRMDPAYPCKPWEKIHNKDSALWSGFKSLDAFMDPPPMWNITVNDTKPLWFYCSAPGSCIQYQMVMSINPDNSTYPITKVQSSASQADFVLSPGEPWPAEAGSAPNPDASGTSGSNAGGRDGGVTLSPGAIAGIVIGGVIALALIGLLFFFVGRKKSSGETKTGAQPANANSPEGGLMNSQTPGLEHPPVYQDPRYASIPPAAPVWDMNKPRVSGAPPMSENPHRVSELGDSNYDPVEIYTPGPDEMPAHRA